MCQPGDYVLASKYDDGDANDPWAIGFVIAGPCGDRILVADASGQPIIFSGGFRRVRKISRKRGAWLLGNAQKIEATALRRRSKRSIWSWLRHPMNKEIR